MKKIFLLTASSIFLIPLASIIPLRGTDLWYPQYLMMLYLLFFGISLFLWDFNKSLSALTFLCLLSTVFISKNLEAVFTLLQLDLSCLAIYFISKFNYRQRQAIIKCVFAMALLQGIWVVVQTMNIDPIFNSISNAKLDDTVGFSGSHNQLAVFFALTAPVVLSTAYYALPLMIFGLFKATTTIAWLGFLAGIIFALGKLNSDRIVKVISILLLIMASIVFFVKFDPELTGSIRQRLEVVKTAVSYVNSGKVLLSYEGKKAMAYCKPLTGYGFSNFGNIYAYSNRDFITGDHYYTHAHNDYLELFFELGYLGLLAMILLFIDFVRRFRRTVKTKELIIYTSCLLAYFICALGVFATHVAVSGMWLVLFYGLFLGATGGEYVKEGKTRQDTVLV